MKKYIISILTLVSLTCLSGCSFNSGANGNKDFGSEITQDQADIIMNGLYTKYKNNKPLKNAHIYYETRLLWFESISAYKYQYYYTNTSYREDNGYKQSLMFLEKNRICSVLFKEKTVEYITDFSGFDSIKEKYDYTVKNGTDMVSNFQFYYFNLNKPFEYQNLVIESEKYQSKNADSIYASVKGYFRDNDHSTVNFDIEFNIVNGYIKYYRDLGVTIKIDYNYKFAKPNLKGYTIYES